MVYSFGLLFRYRKEPSTPPCFARNSKLSTTLDIYQFFYRKNSCASTITENRTYITNPGYPSAYTTTGSCSFTVTPLGANICQLRLDFDSFDLAESSTTGACTDSFEVTVGSSRVYPVLCGTLTGHHIYLETGRSTSAQTLSFTVASSATFKALISQIECSDRNKWVKKIFLWVIWKMNLLRKTIFPLWKINFPSIWNEFFFRKWVSPLWEIIFPLGK